MSKVHTQQCTSSVLDLMRFVASSLVVLVMWTMPLALLGTRGQME